MNVAIVGLGVVGGSLALGLKGNPDYTVYGIDIDAGTLKSAVEMGMICGGSRESQEILPLADVTVLCLYPDVVSRYVEQNAALFKPGSFIMDVTGVKERTVAQVKKVLPPEIDFVFAHPMAGRENRGIAFASGEVLKGANFLLTPVPSNKPENLDLARKLAKDCGFGRITEVTPHEHDRNIAFTSQLSHVIAISLINSDTEEYDTSSFMGDSYRGITRIASINQDLWTQLFFGNKENLLEVIDNFQKQVALMREYIADENEKGLRQLFIKAARRREKLK